MTLSSQWYAAVNSRLLALVEKMTDQLFSAYNLRLEIVSKPAVGYEGCNVIYLTKLGMIEKMFSKKANVYEKANVLEEVSIPMDRVNDIMIYLSASQPVTPSYGMTQPISPPPYYTAGYGVPQQAIAMGQFNPGAPHPSASFPAGYGAPQQAVAMDQFHTGAPHPSASYPAGYGAPQQAVAMDQFHTGASHPLPSCPVDDEALQQAVAIDQFYADAPAGYGVPPQTVTINQPLAYASHPSSVYPAGYGAPQPPLNQPPGYAPHSYPSGPTMGFPQQRVLSVTIPHGLPPAGAMIETCLPDGTRVRFHPPPSAAPGSQILINY